MHAAKYGWGKKELRLRNAIDGERGAHEAEIEVLLEQYNAKKSSLEDKLQQLTLEIRFVLCNCVRDFFFGAR
jgi:hypothetical protein